ncbi:esterase B1 [Nasonia vitripennis]|uniref:Carboxylic ester hydrolase n=1 Tax=Nasonia vitripennis TaxID=7425 RepID=A0A7M7GGC9_NASVI|nr:esterase B1 [Nasonia vitripennis]
MKKPVVKTTCGRLRGSIQKSIEDYEYCAFKGIPYAEPPIGELRFQDPRPPKSWEGVKEATEFGPCCAQYDQFRRLYDGSDDCLYLNVYTKSLKPKTRLPVMMFIHGGAFTFGCGDDMFYGPDYLLKRDIVLVTINYRLGVLGFLNLEDEIAPGNQGFKDQVMALKWIQSNIINFGGDPDNVTVFGESSGGASANYLGLSPMSKNLFHKAISQSGVALNTWASTPSPKQYAYKLCKSLGREIHDSQEIIEFLRSIDCLELAKVSEKIRTKEEKKQLLYPFGPGVDDKSENPFLTEPISEAAKRGMDIPYLAGYNNREGIYSLAGLQGTPLEEYDNNFPKYLHPHLLDLLKKYNLTPDGLKVLYNCHVLTRDNYAEKFADLLGDMYIVEGLHRTIALQVLNKRAPVYFYKFTYDKGISFTKLMINSIMSGASHFDELPHLFVMRFCETLGIESLQKGTTAYRIMEQMTEMWTNFAKYGRPTPDTSKLIPIKWAPVTNPTLLRYMNIGHELMMDGMLNVEQRLCRGRPMKNKL